MKFSNSKVLPGQPVYIYNVYYITWLSLFLKYTNTYVSVVTAHSSCSNRTNNYILLLFGKRILCVLMTCSAYILVVNAYLNFKTLFKVSAKSCITI